jgi:hypothetical protein
MQPFASNGVIKKVPNHPVSELGLLITEFGFGFDLWVRFMRQNFICCPFQILSNCVICYF